MRSNGRCGVAVALCVAMVACSSEDAPLDTPGASVPEATVNGVVPSNAQSPGDSPAEPAAPPAQAAGSEQGPPSVDVGGLDPASQSGTVSSDAGIATGAPSAPDAGSSTPPSTPPSNPPSVVPGPPLTIFLAGDSTVSTYADTASPNDQAGWGQMLPEHFDSRVTVENRAIGGRTARRFIEEGFLSPILADLEPGDYLFVQFGTNDGNRTATYVLGNQTIPYFLDPNTDFKAYLRQYLNGARAASAIPVLVTPPPRNSAYCVGGNGTGAHAQAMRELGAEEGVSVVDLNAKSVAFLMAICPAPTPENFFLLRADGTVDGTHFQERGARGLAGLVADGVRESVSLLAEYLE